MKGLPEFKSEEEEARFWDTHSPLDYPNEFTDVKKPLESPHRNSLQDYEDLRASL